MIGGAWSDWQECGVADANVERLVGEWRDWWERGMTGKSVKMMEERYTRHIRCSA